MRVITGLCFMTLVACLALPVHGARADEAGASPWQKVAGARVRLVAVPSAVEGVDDNRLDAAVEFEIDPGWHIYWRFPGETGIPTEADFSASSGITEAQLRFPAPQRHFDGAFTSIVYETHALLPVDLRLETEGSRAELVADLRFGICSDICVPGEARLALALPPESAPSARRPAIDAARATLATPQGKAAPRVTTVTASPAADPDAAPEILIEVQLAGADEPVDLFAEGVAGSYNGVPVLVERTGARARFSLSGEGFIDAADGSRPLRLTLIDGARTVEHDVDLAPIFGRLR